MERSFPWMAGLLSLFLTLWAVMGLAYWHYGTLDPCDVVREDFLAGREGEARANAEAYYDLTLPYMPREVCFDMLWERWRRGDWRGRD